MCYEDLALDNLLYTTAIIIIITTVIQYIYRHKTQTDSCFRYERVY